MLFESCFNLMIRSRMSIAQCHSERFMSEKLLHCLQVYAVHHRLRGEGMHQVMKVEIFQPCPSACRGKGMLHKVYPIVQTKK